MARFELMNNMLERHDTKDNGDIEIVRLVLDSLSDMDMGKFIGEIRAACALGKQIETTATALLHDVSNCPFCNSEMKGIKLTHYKCKKCDEYFTD